MSTHIEWAEDVWNPVVGCSLASPGCTNCYAMRWAARLQNMGLAGYKNTVTRVNDRDVWTGHLNLQASVLDKPLRRKKPTTYFVNSMGDLFHEDVPEEWIDRVFEIMLRAPQHIFLILTKRPDRMRDYVEVAFHRHVAVPRHIWLGFSAEDQRRFDQRVGEILPGKPAHYFVSCEPLLGPIDLGHAGDWCNWVIVGGESGSGSRPMQAAWALSLRDQCVEQGISFNFKQWGDYLQAASGKFTRLGKHRTGRLMEGVLHDWCPRPEPDGGEQ